MAKRKSGAPKRKAANAKDPEVKIERALGKTELFFEENWKTITAVAVAILVIVGGVYAFRGLYLVPRAQKASEAMFAAQQSFAQGDHSAALHGDGNNPGFIEIVDKYGSTAEGRLAAHYAGIGFMHEGDLDSALEYLSKYRPTKGAPNAIVNAQNEGLKGDVMVQKGDYQAAIKHFEKAVDAADNNFITPIYLKKLGLAYEAAGDYAAAVRAYRRIADNYPASLEGRDIEKFAAAAEQKL